MEEYKENRLIQDRTMLTTFFKDQARSYNKVTFKKKFFKMLAGVLDLGDKAFEWGDKTLLTGFDNLHKLIRDMTGKLS